MLRTRLFDSKRRRRRRAPHLQSPHSLLQSPPTQTMSLTTSKTKRTLSSKLRSLCAPSSTSAIRRLDSYRCRMRTPSLYVPSSSTVVVLKMSPQDVRLQIYRDVDGAPDCFVFEQSTGDVVSVSEEENIQVQVLLPHIHIRELFQAGRAEPRTASSTLNSKQHDKQMVSNDWCWWISLSLTLHTVAAA